MTLGWKEVSPVVDATVKKLSDQDGHVMGLYERRGVALFEDGSNAAYYSVGHFDVVIGHGMTGTHAGWTELTFLDGSKIFYEYKGEEYTDNPDREIGRASCRERV